MQSGRDYNKKLTTTTGEGLSNSAINAQRVVEPKSVQVSTSGNLQYAGEDDSSAILTGPGDGDYASATNPSPKRWGYTAPTGSRVEVNDTDGSERIEMVHHSGAAVVIDPDGSVFISSTSKRGGGMSTPYGDFFISAGGDIVIKGGSSITIDTPGDLNLNVGGTLTINAGSYKLLTKNMDETIDGAASRSVTNDQSLVVGGIDRRTIAGDSREQVTGTKISDVSGMYTLRVDGDTSTDIGGKHDMKVAGDNSISSQGNTKILTSSNMNVDSGSDMSIAAGGNAKLSGSGSATVVSGGATTVAGGSVHASPPIDRAIHSNQTTQAALASALGGAIGPIPPLQSASTSSPTAASAPSEAQTVEANDIVDSLTSARKFPEYPGNGVLESASKTGFGMISHDETPQAEDVYNEYSSGNSGNINPSYQGGSYDILPEDSPVRDGNIVAKDPGISTPSQYDYSAKISKYFTLGQLVNAKHSEKIPSSSWDSVVKNHILAATNVLDAIKEKFPDMIITSAYRRARSGSGNHVTGRAIDLVVESRSMTKHAEIARFARDFLPVDQVFLEKNDRGRTHVHVRVSSTGQKGSPRVFTCGDKRCQSKTPGIDVAYLVRKGTK